MVTSPESESDADPPMKFPPPFSPRRTCWLPASSVIFPSAAKMSVQFRVIPVTVPLLAEPTSEMSPPPVALICVWCNEVPELDHSTIPRPLVEVPVERPLSEMAVPDVSADVILVK